MTKEEIRASIEANFNEEIKSGLATLNTINCNYTRRFFDSFTHFLEMCRTNDVNITDLAELAKRNDVASDGIKTETIKVVNIYDHYDGKWLGITLKYDNSEARRIFNWLTEYFEDCEHYARYLPSIYDDILSSYRMLQSFYADGTLYVLETPYNMKDEVVEDDEDFVTQKKFLDRDFSG